MFVELQSTQLRRDEVLTAITSVLSVFNMSLLLFIQDKTFQYMSECLSAQNKIHQVVHFVKAQYHQHTCESRNREQKLDPTEAESTM